ncbi:hypothetical protein JCM1840_000272 [Sporobolomyces johnsonii]
MATQRSIRAFLRSVALQPSSRYSAALPPSLPQLASISSPSPSRPFSSTRPHSQATWDTFDPEEAFARPAPSTSPDPVERPSSSSSSDASARNPRRAASASPPPPPPLPPLQPTPSVDDLDPIHLHAYRYHLLRHLGHAPSPEELAQFLHPWLRTQHKRLTTERKREEAKRLLAEQKAEQLDLAWEWTRKQEEAAGIPRSPQELRKDEIVRRRIERRAQEKMRVFQEQQERARSKSKKTRSSTVDADESGSKTRSSTVDAVDADKAGDRAGDGDEEAQQVPEWKKHQQALRAQFPEGWAPPKRISREAMDLVRELHRAAPEIHTVPVLADKFKISPEAVRRILKSRFELPREEREKREKKRREERKLAVERDGANQGGGYKWAGDRAAERWEMMRIKERRST